MTVTVRYVSGEAEKFTEAKLSSACNDKGDVMTYIVSQGHGTTYIPARNVLNVQEQP